MRHLEPQMLGSRLYEEPQSSSEGSQSEASGDEEDDVQTLYRRQKQIQDSRAFELSMAFGAGGFALMVLLSISRVWNHLRHGAAYGYSRTMAQEPSEAAEE